MTEKTRDRAAKPTLVDAITEEIERWMRSDRIAHLYAPEIARGEDITAQSARDLAYYVMARVAVELAR